MNSIKTKQTILIVVGVFLSAILVGMLGIITTGGVLEDNSAKELQLLCKNEQDRMNETFSHITFSVDSLADYVTYNAQSVEQLSDNKDALQEYTDRVEMMAQLLASRTEGVVAFYFRYNPEYFDSREGFFWSKKAGKGDLVRFPTTDLAAYEPTDMEHVAWYYVPVANQKPTWLEPYYNMNDDIYMISYVVPIYVEDKLLGIVGMDLDFDIIIDGINDVQIFDEGFAYLLDEKKQCLYHPDYEMGELVPEATEDTADIRVQLDNGMYLGISAKYNDIHFDRNKLMIQVIGLAIVIALGFSIISIMMSRHMIRPLLELNEAAKRIADGDLNVTITKNTSKDEIGVLTENFGKTVEHLKEYVKCINDMAYKDSLTGVQNVNSYRHEVEVMCRKLEEKPFEFAIVIADVNSLKEANDTLGHEAGNQVIMESARYVLKTFSPGQVYRIGGDEFAVILTGRAYEKREAMMKEFFEKQKELCINHDGRKVSFSLAIGMAEYDAALDKKYLDVFSRADEIMYRNKEEVKSRLHMPKR